VPPPGSLRLPDGEVHLWYEVLDAARDDLWREAAQRIATDAERARCERFVFPEGRRECLAARCMARSILSRYTDVHPSEWRFGSNRFGRPEITEPAHATQLRFNLSHADGLVACVVSAHYDVGVDVERFGRLPSMQLAESRFAASEVAALRALPDAEQARRFLEYWTLKEAYVKARGSGLAVPLDQFAFDLSRPGRPRIEFRHGFDDDHRAWQFDRLFVGTDHLVAVATRHGARPPVSVVVHAFDTALLGDGPS
jgi:4'-phosphopantetheinyl transferase